MEVLRKNAKRQGFKCSVIYSLTGGIPNQHTPKAEVAAATVGMVAVTKRGPHIVGNVAAKRRAAQLPIGHLVVIRVLAPLPHIAAHVI